MFSLQQANKTLVNQAKPPVRPNPSFLGDSIASSQVPLLSRDPHAASLKNLFTPNFQSKLPSSKPSLLITKNTASQKIYQSPANNENTPKKGLLGLYTPSSTYS
jgi:hypothetical protein